MRRILISTFMAVLITGCATTKSVNDKPTEIPPQPKVTTPATMSELAQGKRLFQEGYYKRAMEQLLPLAAEGNMEAQYAVGYMYYYGFGAAQDTDSGYFWIKRSASQDFKPAINALAIMNQDQKKRRKPQF